MGASTSQNDYSKQTEEKKLTPQRPQDIGDMNEILANVISNLEEQLDNLCKERAKFATSAQTQITDLSLSFANLKSETNDYCLDFGPMFQELVDDLNVLPDAAEFKKAAAAAKSLAARWGELANSLGHLKRQIAGRERGTWKKILFGVMVGVSVVLVAVACWHLVIGATAIGVIGIVTSGGGLFTSTAGLIRSLFGVSYQEEELRQLRELVEQMEDGANTCARLFGQHAVELNTTNRTVQAGRPLNEERRRALLKSFVDLQAALFGPPRNQRRVSTKTLAITSLVMNVGAVAIATLTV